VSISAVVVLAGLHFAGLHWMRYQLLDDNVKVITAKLQSHAWITALLAPCSPGF